MWKRYQNGATVGQPGFCGGVIVRDEFRAPKVRAVLERDCEDEPWCVLCSIEGEWAYIRPVESDEEVEFTAMLEALAAISEFIPDDDDPDRDSKLEELRQHLDGFEDRFQ